MANMGRYDIDNYRSCKGDGMKYIIDLPDTCQWVQWINLSTIDGHAYFDFKSPEDLIPLDKVNMCHGCLYEDGMKEHDMCHICSNAYEKQWTAK